MEIQDISNAYERVGEIDIIATSGADWSDPHDSLLRCMKTSESSFQTLQDEGVVGDLMWRPLGAKNPILTPTELRALTLVELTDLPGFIEQGKKVLLMLGPCAECNRHKGSILQTILSQDMQLVTHVVVDSRTAGYLVKAIDAGRA
jgi:hypothetical protein